VENLLLLIHRMPYPPNKGDKIRSYHLLKHLAQHYRVHLATFVDDEDDWQHVPLVQALCASSHFGKLNPLTGKLRSLGARWPRAARSRSTTTADGEMQAWVDQTMAAHKIDRVLVFSSPMAQYAENYPAARRVVDFCDVDSDKWRQYAGQKPWPMSWLYRREADTLLAYERHVAATCDASLFVSDPEAALFRTLAPESAAKIGYFNNGVDTDYFSPERAYERPYGAGERALVFTGAMDYWPNIDAVQWFANEIFPQLYAATPALRFYIVGARPSAAVPPWASCPAWWSPAPCPTCVRISTTPKCGGAAAHCARYPEQGARSDGDGAPDGGVAAGARRHRRAARHRAAARRRRRRLHFHPVVPGGHAQRRPWQLAARSKVERQYSWPSNLARIEARLECS
jgi:sugar transferase (PEP-CTERM/EpsH1 system associated)